MSSSYQRGGLWEGYREPLSDEDESSCSEAIGSIYDGSNGGEFYLLLFVDKAAINIRSPC